MKRVAYLLVLPAVVFFAAFPFLATYMVGHLSLFDTNYISSTFVGFENYVKLLTDAMFWRSMMNAIIYCAVIVPITVMIALVISVWISDFKPRAQNFFRISLYIPCFSAGVIISGTWKWILDYRTGLANWLIGLVGIQPVMWLANPVYAIGAICMVMVFATMGPTLMMYSAAIMSVPHEIVEQSKIDGASWLQTKFGIVVPMIMPTILLTVLLCIIGTMQIWEFIYGMTYGGPAGGTATPVFDIYITGFSLGKYGYASAKSIVLLVVILAISLIKQQIEKMTK